MVTAAATVNSGATERKRKIFVVDDHPLVREMLTDLINRQPDLFVCGDADSAPEALEKIAACEPDVAIVDLSLRNSSGLGLIDDLVAVYPTLAVLVLSTHDESIYAERVLRCGARGYIMKQEATHRVIEGIRRVLQGNIYVSHNIADAMACQLAQVESPARRLALADFTDRELEIFELLGQGYGGAQIASMLHVSTKTVHFCYGRMRERLKVDSLRELVREALRWHEKPR
jgi:DNA-binding NarL/FixJ family response regulator